MLQNSPLRLRDICTIQMGYTARKRLEPIAEGGVLALQLRDVSAGQQVRIDLLERVQLDDAASRYLVHDGDVIFRSRGEQTMATVIEGAANEKVVAILPLMILRPDPARALPEYVAWAMNLPASQRHLDANSQGGSIRMVPKSAIDDLPIDLPNLATQRRIVAIAALARQEAALAASLAEKQLARTTQMLAHAARHGMPHLPAERTK